MSLSSGVMASSGRLGRGDEVSMCGGKRFVCFCPYGELRLTRC